MPTLEGMKRNKLKTKLITQIVEKTLKDEGRHRGRRGKKMNQNHHKIKIPNKIIKNQMPLHSACAGFQSHADL